MTRPQFLAFNAIAAVLTVLILANLYLARVNQQLTQKIAQNQALVSAGRQAEAALRQLTVRIARGSEQDPELRKLLLRNELKAILTGADGRKKEYP